MLYEDVPQLGSFKSLSRDDMRVRKVYQFMGGNFAKQMGNLKPNHPYFTKDYSRYNTLPI